MCSSDFTSLADDDVITAHDRPHLHHVVMHLRHVTYVIYDAT